MSVKTKQEQIKQVRTSSTQIQRPDMVVDSESQAHGFKRTTKKCVWALGSVCFGKKFTAAIFSDQLRVPICQHHLDGHRVIMTIVSNMADVQRTVAIPRVLDMSEEERLTIVRNRNYKLVPWGKV